MLRRGILKSVRVRPEGGIVLDAEVDGVILPAVLLWDGMPTPASVAAALSAWIGRRLEELAEVEV
jgi:hypothetical protein